MLLWPWPKLRWRAVCAERRPCGSGRRSALALLTPFKLNGKWVYLYRTIDKFGGAIDFLLRAKRDAVAAKAFFRKAFKENGTPDKVNVDKSGSNKAALDSFNKDLPEDEQIEVRQNKYLNNIVE
jgi:putative transposase